MEVSEKEGKVHKIKKLPSNGQPPIEHCKIL
jgi:hypothetical protein